MYKENIDIEEKAQNNTSLHENVQKDNVNPPPPKHMVKQDSNNHNNNPNNNNPNNNNLPSTYIEIITEKDEQGQPTSVLEVDLVISREKGKETRKLSMNFAGIDFEKNEMVEKSIDLDKDSFEHLKRFFSQLDWNS